MAKAIIKLNLVFGKDEDNDDYVQVEGDVLSHEGLQDDYERAFLVNFMQTFGRIIDPMLKDVHEKTVKSSSTKEEQIPSKKLH